MIKWHQSLLLASFLFACSPGKNKGDSNQTVASTPQENVEAGKSIYNSTCKTCHGDAAEGNQKFQAPALANTDKWYLYKQLMNFRNGLRGYDDKDTLSFQMAAMAKALKDSTAAIDVVAYIESLPEASISLASEGDKKNGENIYHSVCGSCHGPNASGNEKLYAPRLSGLSDWYLKSQIKKFKTSVRGAHPNDKLGAQMIAMMALLPDEKSINDVINYIQSAKPVSK